MAGLPDVVDRVARALPALLADAERLHVQRRAWQAAKARAGHAAAVVKPLRREIAALETSGRAQVLALAPLLVGTLADLTASVHFFAPVVATSRRLIADAAAHGDLEAIASTCEVLRASRDLPDALGALGYAAASPLVAEVAQALEALAVVARTVACGDYAFRRPPAAA